MSKSRNRIQTLYEKWEEKKGMLENEYAQCCMERARLKEEEEQKNAMQNNTRQEVDKLQNAIKEKVHILWQDFSFA